MPSASSKSEKPASTEAADPLKQAIVIIEHKIRNLEKRKSKLDSYKEIINLLTKEQVEAISKYDEVVQQLELSKEYVKQFTLISNENNKLKKRQAKREALEKYMAEVNKVKQVLLIQDVLQSMGTESVKEDFLTGRNGAIKLTPDDLKTLNDLQAEVSSKQKSEDGTTDLNDQFQKAAEYYMAIIEGKSKEIAGSNGAKLKELVNSIHTSGYFDKQASGEVTKAAVAPTTENEIMEEEEEFHENQEILTNVIVPTQNPPEGNLAPIPNSTPVPIIPGPILQVSQPPVMQPNQQQIMANVPNIVPTPVSQVESSFFNAQGFKPPAPPSVVPPPSQNARQLNDVIQSVTGKFNFLQESELDLAEMNSGIPGNPPVAPPQMSSGPPSAIPTQTFTNQNFNGQPNAAPNFPPSYPPQPAAFQAFVPAFQAFVTPNATSVQNNNSTTLSSNSANPTVVGPVNSVNSNIPTSNSNIHNSNKSNSIPNSIPLAPNRNPVSFNQGQQQITSGFPNQADGQNMPQTSPQPVFQSGNLTAASVDNVNNEAVRKENEIKEKQESEKQDWSQPESTNWADECAESSEWNSLNQNQSDGPSNGNKFSSGRPNRNLGGVPRNPNGYQGSRPRTHRQGGYRDSHITSNAGGNSNYYQNQNDYQSRNDRTNEFPVGNKGNSDLKDGTFKERGDFNNRDREPKENYGGGFKRGPPSRGHNMKGPMDRGDRQGQMQRNNPSGPRGPRNVNKQSNSRNGSSFQRQQPNVVGPNK